MTNYDYKKISSEYAQALYPDLDTETRSIIEKEGLDFISNLLKKIHSIGSNFLFFEDNGSFNLELRESIGMDMHMDSFLDEGGEEEGYFRFSKETNGSLDFSTDDIVIDTEGIYGGEIEEIRQILVQSDGRERVVTSPGSALSELIPLTDCDLIVDAYQNRHQVDVWNLSDPYFMRDEDEDESNIFLLNIKYPKMGLKYQGLIPHLKKFIREDLQHSNSTLNPIKIIKSMNIVPISQKSLSIFATVSNNKIEDLIDKQDQEGWEEYGQSIQTELDKAGKRLNRVLSDHCDMNIEIILNLRSKYQNFSAIATKRVKEIVHQIGTLENLTNKQYYNSSRQDWEKIRRKLVDSVYRLENKLITKERNDEVHGESIEEEK